MEIPSKYVPKHTEEKWYRYWLENGFFHSEPDEREPYTIVIPPPNVTGVLHMGHMLNNTIQDILIRRARMIGKNACWVPGTDHASIATEAKVVNKLKEEGIDKKDLTRDEFLKHAWDWTDKHGGIILEQLKRLGASCDWERTCFTMDEERYDSVIDVFIDLYKKGYIYRGVRMVNWDPQAQTAVSDEEVIYTEEQSKLYYCRYKIVGSDEFVTIATTRPETILGDTAVCVNPSDERYTHLHGKKVIVPLVNREVPIIEDEHVDVEFGTGCLKITPAHDINDYEIGIKHNLESIDILNDDGTLSEKAEVLVGVERFEARKQIIPLLKNASSLIKEEDYTNKVGRSERTNAVIEPKLSMQWFLKMKDISKPALDAVLNDEIKLHPPKFKNTYRHWMENVKDWCISRQLWWGHRFPVYYIDGTNEYVVAKTVEQAVELAKEKTGNNKLTVSNLRQDEDSMDTWFSSWLWPISVFDGIRKPDSKEINYYYSTSDLITAPDIIFFWVARMIIAGYEYRDAKPFENVYFTGMVRDKQRRKMSKSLGNSPDPIELIEKFGADGVRVGMLLCSPAGGDLLFDDSLTEQGRNFANKIWNAFRLVKGWIVEDKTQPEYAKVAVEWFGHKFNEVRQQLDSQFDAYRLSEALMSVYKLFWDEFSGWFLEMIKPDYQTAIDKKTYEATIAYFNDMLHILHPFMPFITEEIWHYIEERSEGESLMISQMPAIVVPDKKVLEGVEKAKEVITFIRNTRKEKQLANKEMLNLQIKADGYISSYDAIIQRLGFLETLEIVNEKPEGAISFISKDAEYYLPLGALVNTEEEIKKLKEELNYTQGFLNSVLKKLSNERFVNNAPQQVVANEQKKKEDAEAKIKAIEEQISALNE